MLQKHTLNDMIYWKRTQSAAVRDDVTVFMLHWMTGSAERMAAQFNGLLTNVAVNFLEGQHPSELEEGGYSWFAHGIGFYNLSPEERSTLVRQQVDRIGTFLEAYQAQHKTKCILIGMSQGAAVVNGLAAVYPEYIDLAIASSGRMLMLMPENTHRTLPIVRIQHGENDEVISIDEGYQAFQWFEKNGFDATFYRYESGHYYSQAMKADIEEWISIL